MQSVSSDSFVSMSLWASKSSSEANCPPDDTEAEKCAGSFLCGFFRLDSDNLHYDSLLEESIVILSILKYSSLYCVYVQSPC